MIMCPMSHLMTHYTGDFSLVKLCKQRVINYNDFSLTKAVKISIRMGRANTYIHPENFFQGEFYLLGQMIQLNDYTLV
jgi:hypothetical protein